MLIVQPLINDKMRGEYRYPSASPGPWPANEADLAPGIVARGDQLRPGAADTAHAGTRNDLGKGVGAGRHDDPAGALDHRLRLLAGHVAGIGPGICRNRQRCRYQDCQACKS
jgi:hypothetical protein